MNKAGGTQARDSGMTADGPTGPGGGQGLSLSGPGGGQGMCGPGRRVWVATYSMWAVFVSSLFLAGFVLPAWWLATAHPGGVPGLGAYPSAFIGDTLLLPAGCLVLATGIRRLAPVRRERVVAAASAAAAAVIAIAAQADWLYDPTTQLNWTMPRTGHFSPPGWWHAGYFVLMSMTVATLTVVFLARARNARRDGGAEILIRMSSGKGAAILLAAFGSYAALSIHDDLASRAGRSSASLLGLAAFTLAVALALVVVAYGRRAAVLLRPAAMALAGGAVIVISAVGPLVVGISLGSVAAVVASGAVIARQRRLPRRRLPRRRLPRPGAAPGPERTDVRRVTSPAAHRRAASR